MAGLNVEIRNFTPHDPITFFSASASVVLPQQGLARCGLIETESGYWDDENRVRRVLVEYGDVAGLPEPAAGTVVLVSQLVVRAVPERADLAFPHDLVRDDEGTVIGFNTLARLGAGA